MGVWLRKAVGMTAAVALTLGGLAAFVFPPIVPGCTLHAIAPLQMILEIDNSPGPAMPVLLRPQLARGDTPEDVSRTAPSGAPAS